VVISLLHHVPEELEGFEIVLVLFKKFLDLGLAVGARLDVPRVRFGVVWIVVWDY
jgi:hypothetical protein